MTASAQSIISLLCTALLAVTAWQLKDLKTVTADSTAEAARRWALAAVAACIAAAMAQLPWMNVSRQLQSAAQYFAAVMLLTPFIAILGARRPGATAWPWFVVLPLIVVLQWPAVSQLLSESRSTAMQIPTPTVVGFLFVLLMGAGNYIGTRHTAAALFVGSGICLILAPLTEMSEDVNRWAFPAGCLLIMLAGVWIRQADHRSDSDHIGGRAGGVQDLWARFQDVYGIVWAKRVTDRVNQFAVRESWPVRLTLYGFVDDADSDRNTQIAISESGPETGAVALEIPERAVEVLCWVLKRFVDPPFVRRFLPDATPYSMVVHQETGTGSECQVDRRSKNG